MKNYFKITKSERPHWFVDAKWVFGLLFLVAFSVSLMTYNLAQLTSRERATEVISETIEMTLDKVKIDLDLEIAEYKASLENNQEETTEDQSPARQFIAQGINIAFPNSDVQSLSVEELKGKFLLNLAVPFYEGGTDMMFNLVSHLDIRGVLDDSLQNLSIYSDETHDQIQSVFVLSLIVSIILLIGVIFFSFGWGRIFVPGLLLFATCLPGYILGVLSHDLLTEFQLAKIGEEGLVNIFLGALLESLKGQVASITVFYSVLFYIGVALMIGAVAGRYVYKYLKKKKTSSDDVHS